MSTSPRTYCGALSELAKNDRPAGIPSTVTLIYKDAWIRLGYVDGEPLCALEKAGVNGGMLNHLVMKRNSSGI